MPFQYKTEKQKQKNLSFKNSGRIRIFIFCGLCRFMVLLRRRRGQQRMGCVEGITDSVDMSLSILWEMVRTVKAGMLQADCKFLEGNLSGRPLLFHPPCLKAWP